MISCMHTIEALMYAHTLYDQLCVHTLTVVPTNTPGS